MHWECSVRNLYDCKWDTLVSESASTEHKLILFTPILGNTDFTWCKLHWLPVIMYIMEVNSSTAFLYPLCPPFYTTVSFKNSSFTSDNLCSRARGSLLARSRARRDPRRWHNPHCSPNENELYLAEVSSTHSESPPVTIPATHPSSLFQHLVFPA